MNERIKELAAQVEKYISTTNFEGMPEDEMTYDEIFQKKFAELIVKECLKELRYTVVDTQECRQGKSMDYQVGWEDGMFDAGETIKEHFGVE